MAKYDISVIGGAELQRIFETLPDRLEKKVLTRAIKDGAQFLAYLIGNQAPRSAQHRGAGVHMADTFHVVPLKARRGRVGASIMPGTRQQLGIETPAQGAQRQQAQLAYKAITKALRKHSTYFYPAGVEVGTRTMRPRAFMRGPLHASSDAVLAVIRQSLDDGIERELLRG